MVTHSQLPFIVTNLAECQISYTAPQIILACIVINTCFVPNFIYRPANNRGLYVINACLVPKFIYRPTNNHHLHNSQPTFSSLCDQSGSRRIPKRWLFGMRDDQFLYWSIETTFYNSDGTRMATVAAVPEGLQSYEKSKWWLIYSCRLLWQI